MLETVLQETLVATSAKEAAQWIESFARRVSFDDISDPANAEELIREILGKRLVGWNLPGWLPRRVAEIFLEDPVARSRLIALWGEARRNVR